jgi:aspartyl-tRNA(Asn)/glutamyl-tRNA(Gln) amidotransferase subunit B
MTDPLYENWVPVIGLEIHVQLNTKTKMFGTEAYAFGHEPNLDIGVVATGQPGALPVVNREAVKKAVQFGCAIKSNISLFTRFDRKSYFYPDNPKNFQITQFDYPIITGGVITCDVEGKTKHFQVHHAHLEEDSGMLKHFTNFTGVDFNRSGVPLLEIVSEPCMHSPKDASSYAMAVKAIMEFLDASNGNMEDGSLRVDVNISVRRKDETELRPKVEIKNLNSFSKMEAAIESEIRRQVKFYSDHPHETLERGTYRFDLETNQIVLMRIKESADDYRYFPEPDIPPLYITESYINEIKTTLPELPYDRLNRYLKEYDLSPQTAAVLTSSKRLSNYFEQTLSLHPNPKAIAMWMTVEFAGRLKEKGQALWDAGITPAHLAELVSLIDKNTITGKIAKSVADEMVLTPHLTPSHIVHLNPDFQPIHDTSAIEPIVDRVLADNPQSIADFKAGKTKAFAFLVGQVMKECRGKASPDIVNTLLQKKIS